MRLPALLIALAIGVSTVACAREVVKSYDDNCIIAPQNLPAVPGLQRLRDAVTAGAIVLTVDHILRWPVQTPPLVQTPPIVGITDAPMCLPTGLVQEDELALPAETCSGVLISRKRVLTAAHCLLLNRLNGDRTDNKKLVISLGHTQPLVGSPTPEGVVKEAAMDGDVFAIEKAIYCKRSRKIDLAIVELAQPVPARYVHAVRRPGKPVSGEIVHFVSSPVGLPIKLSTCAATPYDCTNAIVKDVGATLFRATTDSYKGSSGGGVYDDSGDLIGIFSGGLNHETGVLCFDNMVYPGTCPGDIFSRIDELPAKFFDDNKSFNPVDCDIGPKIQYPTSCPEAPVAPKNLAKKCSAI